MRFTTVQGYRTSHVFRAAEEALELCQFTLLHADNHNLFIEAIKEQGMISKKHVSIRFSKMKNGVEACIEVRNVGLELRRERQNDLLEARIERSLQHLLRTGKSQTSAA